MRKRFLVFVAFACLAVPAFTAASIVIHVDDDAAPGGNGSGQSPYNTLAAALEAAKATSESVRIIVAPGEYAITETLTIDRSLDLRGSTELLKDTDGWATGDAAAGTETRIVAGSSLGSQPVILVGRSDATVLDDVSIRGFVFQGTTSGIQVLLTRVQDYVVKANIFRAPALFALQSVASSGRVTGNHFRGVGTGAIFAGGYPESPSSVVFTGNRSVGNATGGVLLNGVSINLPELGDQLDAVVRGNDLSDNTGSPNQSFGLRVFILRRDLGAPGDTQSSARVNALVQDNRIVGNRIGIVVDAGFPYRRVGTVCDTRVYSGAVDLEFVDNTVTGSLLTPALVTFTRIVAGLNQALLPQWQYLHDATFVISDPDGALAEAWIDHPELDPFLGPCPGDAAHESLGNVLMYNGAAVPNGRNF
jgi:hypothetical protein